MFETRMLPWKQLVPPAEPLRVSMSDDSMTQLVESLRTIGQLQPLLVKPYGDGPASQAAVQSLDALIEFINAGNNFEIIDGHRRWHAAQLAGIELLSCTIVDPADLPAHAAMLHANIIREDVTPAEEGWQFLELATKHGWGIEQLCHTFRVSENYINDRVELVQKDAGVAAAAQSRQVNLAQAKQILRAKDPTLRTYLLDQATTHGANARSLEVMRHNWQAEQDAAQGALLPHTPPASVSPDPAGPEVCVWCGQGHDPENFHRITVHWYHKPELLAVVEQVCVKNVILGASAPAKEG